MVSRDFLKKTVLRAMGACLDMESLLLRDFNFSEQGRFLL